MNPSSETFTALSLKVTLIDKANAIETCRNQSFLAICDRNDTVGGPSTLRIGPFRRPHRHHRAQNVIAMGEMVAVGRENMSQHQKTATKPKPAPVDAKEYLAVNGEGMRGGPWERLRIRSIKVSSAPFSPKEKGADQYPPPLSAKART